MSTRQSPRPARIIVAACIGNAMEWYDIAVYSYFAVYLAKAFFPVGSPTVSLLLTFGTFALSYFIRPVGALVLGAYADRIGRKPTLTLTILLMTVGTALIAFTPTYQSIGIAAPLLVMLGRLLQGFSAGGEFGSATALMLEHLPERRGFAGSWQGASQSVSGLLAALMGTVLTATMSSEALSSWAFRIPFIVGLLIAPVGLYVRRYVPETAEFEAVKANAARTASRRQLFVSHLPRMLVLTGIIGLGSALVYSTSYIPTYSVQTLHLPAYVGFLAVVLTGIAQLLFYPIMGYLSDRYRYSSQMLLGVVLIAIVLYPAYALINSWPSIGTLVIALFVLTVVKSIHGASLGAQMGAVFPTEIRGLGMSLSYNAGVALFGGLTPFLTTLLLDATGDPIAPAYLLLGISVLAAICLIVLRACRWDGYVPAPPADAAAPEPAGRP